MKPLFPAPEKLADIGLRLLLIVVVAFLLERLLFLMVARTERLIERAGYDSPHAQQRARTLGQISRNLVTVVIGAGAIMIALEVMGWDVRPLLAGAGILGVALGFGAQTLVRDVIAGFFILFEDQFAVGDLIEVNGRAAHVEAISMRCTTLRDFNGFMHFVPNGEMKIVTNRSRGWNRLAVDVPIASDQDLDKALEVVGRVVEEMNQDSAWQDRLLEPIDLWGGEVLGPSGAQIRMVLRAAPGSEAPRGARELRRRVNAALQAAGIRTWNNPDAPFTPLAPGEPSMTAPPQPPASAAPTGA